MDSTQHSYPFDQSHSWATLSDEGSFFYVAPEGERDGLSQFIDEMKTDGFFRDNAYASETLDKLSTDDFYKRILTKGERFSDS